MVPPRKLIEGYKMKEFQGCYTIKAGDGEDPAKTAIMIYEDGSKFMLNVAAVPESHRSKIKEYFVLDDEDLAIVNAVIENESVDKAVEILKDLESFYDYHPNKHFYIRELLISGPRFFWGFLYNEIGAIVLAVRPAEISLSKNHNSKNLHSTITLERVQNVCAKAQLDTDRVTILPDFVARQSRKMAWTSRSTELIYTYAPDTQQCAHSNQIVCYIFGYFVESFVPGLVTCDTPNCLEDCKEEAKKYMEEFFETSMCYLSCDYVLPSLEQLFHNCSATHKFPFDRKKYLFTHRPLTENVPFQEYLAICERFDFHAYPSFLWTNGERRETIPAWVMRILMTFEILNIAGFSEDRRLDLLGELVLLQPTVGVKESLHGFMRSPPAPLFTPKHPKDTFAALKRKAQARNEKLAKKKEKLLMGKGTNCKKVATVEVKSLPPASEEVEEYYYGLESEKSKYLKMTSTGVLKFLESGKSTSSETCEPSESTSSEDLKSADISATDRIFWITQPTRYDEITKIVAAEIAKWTSNSGDSYSSCGTDFQKVLKTFTRLADAHDIQKFNDEFLPLGIGITTKAEIQEALKTSDSLKGTLPSDPNATFHVTRSREPSSKEKSSDTLKSSISEDPVVTPSEEPIRNQIQNSEIFVSTEALDAETSSSRNASGSLVSQTPETEVPTSSEIKTNPISVTSSGSLTSSEASMSTSPGVSSEVTSLKDSESTGTPSITSEISTTSYLQKSTQTSPSTTEKELEVARNLLKVYNKKAKKSEDLEKKLKEAEENLEKKNKVLKERNQKIEKLKKDRNMEIKAKNKEIDDLKGFSTQLTKTSNALETSKKELKNFRIQAEKFQLELLSKSNELCDTKKTLKSSESKNVLLKENVKILNTKLEDVKNQKTESEGRMRRANDILLAKIAEQKKEVEDLKLLNKNTLEENVELKEKIEDLNMRNSKPAEEEESLESRISTQSQEIERLQNLRASNDDIFKKNRDEIKRQKEEIERLQNLRKSDDEIFEKNRNEILSQKQKILNLEQENQEIKEEKMKLEAQNQEFENLKIQISNLQKDESNLQKYNQKLIAQTVKQLGDIVRLESQLKSKNLRTMGDDLNEKDREILGLKMRIETMERQHWHQQDSRLQERIDYLESQVKNQETTIRVLSQYMAKDAVTLASATVAPPTFLPTPIPTVSTSSSGSINLDSNSRCSNTVIPSGSEGSMNSHEYSTSSSPKTTAAGSRPRCFVCQITIEENQGVSECQNCKKETHRECAQRLHNNGGTCWCCGKKM